MEEKFYREVNDSLKMVFDITSRIDERMKVLVENNIDLRDKIEKLYDQHVVILNRLVVLENKNSLQALGDLKTDINSLESKFENMSGRLINVEKEVTQNNSKWTNIVDFIFKLGVVVIGGIILWKLGLKP